MVNNNNVNGNNNDNIFNEMEDRSIYVCSRYGEFLDIINLDLILLISKLLA